MLSSAEIAKSTRTLICLLQSLIGEKILIELRNNHFVLGTLQSVDCYMNMELIDTLVWSLDSWIINKLEANETIKTNADEETVIETDKLPDSKWLSEQTRADYLFLKGCRLRYFFLPETVNVFDCIEKQLKVYRSRRNDSDDRHQQRPFNWKCYRKRLKLIQKQNLSESSTTDA
ncbi:hypothetical protein SSS_10141 [Sarcoptes scabiei]|uniref:Sm domain-containing protein n=2 Tax=Sarcoptes scabiei TaxID=52283 RepID=A0A834R9C0_SARSC|nr:hypothetical protein SSS_10141 [Sarcoptes scabiei]